MLRMARVILTIWLLIALAYREVAHSYPPEPEHFVSVGSGSECGFEAGADLVRRLPASFLATRSRKLPVGKSFSFAFLYFVSQAVRLSLLA